jgi:protein SCO1/2
MANETVSVKPTRQSRITLLATLILAIGATFFILFSLFNRPGARTSSAPNGGAAIIEGQGFNGVEVIEPPRTVKDFTAVNQDGRQVNLSDLKGKPVLLFFGFTNCPDFCPGTLLEYKKIRLRLGEQATQVAFVMISVDPKRDTPEVIKTYLVKFDPAIIGLRAEPDTLRLIASDYALYVEEVLAENGKPEEYTISHTPNSFLLSREGKLVASYLFGTEAEVIVENLSPHLES